MAKVTSTGSEKEFKVIVIGDQAVGKTSLMYRYDKGTVLINPKLSCGLEVIKKEVEINGKYITVHIWDTAGQERYRAVTSSLYRYAEAVIIVYDITRKETFESLQYWLDECEENGIDIKAPKIIIANKCDCKEDKTVPTKDGKKFAKKHNIPFYETTSKMDSDIEEIFLELMLKLQEERSVMGEKKGNTENIRVGKAHDFRNSNCCSGNSVRI